MSTMTRRTLSALTAAVMVIALSAWFVVGAAQQQSKLSPPTFQVDPAWPTHSQQLGPRRSDVDCRGLARPHLGAAQASLHSCRPAAPMPHPRCSSSIRPGSCLEAGAGLVTATTGRSANTGSMSTARDSSGSAATVAGPSPRLRETPTT